MIKNRIISYGLKPADQFIVNPDNFRIHPEEQQKVVKSLLHNIGWVGVVLESANTGYVIDGHERVWEALQDNSNVPYLLVDLTEEEERVVLTAYDASGHMAGIDRPKAKELIDELMVDARQWQEEVLKAVSDEYALEAPAGFVPPAPSEDAPSAREITCPHCGAKFYDE